ncbi:hypothetical protein PS850_06121 [Pseudomonas fluorescens]|nr:hypothetical protein PS850_06121 [Pseudomonas fluorescens]
METPKYSSSSISNALAKKSKEAFGVDPSASFDVSGVQNHKTDVTYTVTAKYDYRVVCAPVSAAIGTLYSPEGASTLVNQRGREFLSDAGKTFRERVLNALKAKPQRFKRGEKFTLYADQSHFCSIEACHPCAGHGSVNCHRCGGDAKHLCEKCSGGRYETCTGCFGNGWATHNCLQCGGSGNYAGNVCSVCRGSGQPTIKCYTCYGNKVMPCRTCDGQGQQQCGNCHGGQVTCGTCHGARTLTYAYHVEIDVSTSVSYGWKGGAAWMGDVIHNAVKSGGPDNIFNVKTYESESTDPYKIVGIGYVEGGEATVQHNGASGNCRFIGDLHHTVFLDGILSGAFKSSLDGIAKAEDIKAVSKASKTQIAVTLVKEVEYGTATVKSSSPVKKGIISVDQATTFLDGRAACQQYIANKGARFSLRHVLRFTAKIFVPMFVFYLLLNIFARIHPESGGTIPGRLGLGALLTEFGSVVRVFCLEPQFLWMKLTSQFNPLPLLAYALLGWVTARAFGPVLFPVAWKKPSNAGLALYGMILTSTLMALYPTVLYVFQFSDLLYAWTKGDPGYALSLTLYLTPQILLLSFVIAIVRYKTAGLHWTNRMRAKLAVS